MRPVAGGGGDVEHRHDRSRPLVEGGGDEGGQGGVEGAMQYVRALRGGRPGLVVAPSAGRIGIGGGSGDHLDRSVERAQVGTVVVVVVVVVRPVPLLFLFPHRLFPVVNGARDGGGCVQGCQEGRPGVGGASPRERDTQIRRPPGLVPHPRQQDVVGGGDPPPCPPSFRPPPPGRSPPLFHPSFRPVLPPPAESRPPSSPSTSTSPKSSLNRGSPPAVEDRSERREGSKSRHATGPPNPSANYVLVVIREVGRHDRRMKGGRSRSRGAAYVSLQIARVDFDFPAAPSGSGTRDDGPGIVSFSVMGGPRRSVLGGGGDRIRVVPAAESSLLRLFGATLVAAWFPFLLRAVRDANAPLDGSVGAPLVAAWIPFLLRTVRGANAPLDGSVGAPVVAATFLLRAVRDANAPLDGSVGASLMAATFKPRAMRDANASLDGFVGAPLVSAMFTANAPPLGVSVASLALAFFAHLDDVRFSFY
jgi:hypothetical protein